jgi:hypothetical protein
MSTLGPRQSELLDIISAIPALSKSDALRLAGIPAGGWYAARPINVLVSRGLIVAEKVGGRYMLFASTRDREWFYLRRALLQPGTPAEEVQEISARLRELDEERAVTWTEV